MTARGAAFIIGEMTFPSRFTSPGLPDHRARWTTVALVVMLSTPGAFASILDSANASGSFGLYPAGNFRITTGACTDCPTLRQALWYFRAETIAIPRTGMPVAAWTPGVHAYDDILQWAGTRPVDAAIDYPPLVWIAAPLVARHARMSADGRELMTPDGALPFRPVAKIPLNRSYYDASSVAWLGDRALTVRGTSTPEGFIARSFWPDAWASCIACRAWSICALTWANVISEYCCASGNKVHVSDLSRRTILPLLPLPANIPASLDFMVMLLSVRDLSAERSVTISPSEASSDIPPAASTLMCWS